MPFESKYGVARHIYVPLVKRGVVDFAISTDYAFSAGDAKISKDGGAFTNVTNAPVAINSANQGAVWDFSLTATEMQAAQVVVVLSDATSGKQVEDQSFIIATYGNASALHVEDRSITTENKVWDAVASSHVTAGTMGALGQLADSGTAQAGASTTITLRAGAPSVDLTGRFVALVAGTGRNQYRQITAYNTSTKVATVAAWKSDVPDTTTQYAVI